MAVMKPDPPEAQYVLKGMNFAGPLDRRPMVGPWSKRLDGWPSFSRLLKRISG